MSQPGPDKITFIQREHLCLILQPPERSASYDTVIVLLKLRPQIPGAFDCLIISDSILTQQLPPFHNKIYFSIYTPFPFSQ